MSLCYKIKLLVLTSLSATCFMGWLCVEGTGGPPPPCPDLMKKVKDRLGGCEAIKCDTGLTKAKCPDGSVLEEGVAVCGCCPGCVKYQNLYLGPCNDKAPEGNYDPNCTDLICPILFKCPRGLECREEKCDIPISPTTGDTKHTCENLCFIKKAIIEQENALFAPAQRRHLPSCTQEGKFAPKQCKGSLNNGDCFCVDECGQRLFGREFYGRDENMTCGCTRLVHELRTKNRMATLHCKENGDFEKLQCDTDSALCYCVDEISGKTTGEVLPEANFKLLPCYNGTAEEFSEDGRYLRVCESEWVAGKKISLEGALHGLTYNHVQMTCDYDGGFAGGFIDTDILQETCVHRSGDRIAPGYFRAYSSTKSPMDCQCARDHVYKTRYGIDGSMVECQTVDTGKNTDPAPGSHKLYHVNERTAYCVDTDGHQFGPDVPAAFACCLDSIGQGETPTCTEPLPECDPSALPYPYKPCLEYKMGRTNSL